MIGNKIISYGIVESTNKTATELLAKGGLEEGSVVVASFQEAGKGQPGNHWESEAGKNLTISVILYPAFLLPEKQFMLNKIISLGVVDFIRIMLPELVVKIKWPNDIYIEQKKVAGILINNVIQGHSLEQTIVGIGVNINQNTFRSDAPNPVSLFQLSGIQYDLKKSLACLCEALDKWYEILKNGNYERIDEQYLNSLYQFDIFKKYRVFDQEMMAKIIGVTNYGKLLLEGKDQKRMECDLKEVVFVLGS